MKTQSRRVNGAAQELAATNSRNFRTFLLMQQFAAQEIGARIEQARKERGMTQEDLADLAAGFSKRSLQDYEAGATIPYKHFRELSRLLKKPEEWFLYGDDATGEVRSDEDLLARLEEAAEKTTESLEGLERGIEQILARLDAQGGQTSTN